MHIDKYYADLKTTIKTIIEESMKFMILKKQNIVYLETRYKHVHEHTNSYDFDPTHMGFNQDDLETIRRKLYVDLVGQSQAFYQNNMQLFTNGISLLSVSSLEIKNNMGILLDQAQ